MLDHFLGIFLVDVSWAVQSKWFASVGNSKQQLSKDEALPQHGGIIASNPAMHLLNASNLERPVDADAFKVAVTCSTDKVKILNPRPAKKT